MLSFFLEIVTSSQQLNLMPTTQNSTLSESFRPVHWICSTFLSCTPCGCRAKNYSSGIWAMEARKKCLMKEPLHIYLMAILNGMLGDLEQLCSVFNNVEQVGIWNRHNGFGTPSFSCRNRHRWSTCIPVSMSYILLLSTYAELSIVSRWLAFESDLRIWQILVPSL